MSFPENLGVIACKCVIFGEKPVLFVSHAGGDWQLYCHWRNHDFKDAEAMKHELSVVHAAHLTAQDPSLNALAGLPVDRAAERERVGGAWRCYEDKDDD